MMLFALHISLIILTIHVLFWEGMILFPLVRVLQLLPVVVKKPLYECMICMSSFWTIMAGLILHIPVLRFEFFVLILTVCGINVILESVIYYLRDH